MRLRWLCAGALASSTWAAVLHADDGGAAQALFDKAVADLEGGRPDAACPAFAESQRLDPRPGTLFALADCEVELGKIATALGHYHEYIGWVSRLTDDQRGRHAERLDLARARVEALQPKVPTLTLVVSKDAPAGLVVERDGVPLQGAALGAALPIDPGEHVIVSRAPGVPEERLTIQMASGDSKTIELPFRPTAPPSTAPPPVPPTLEPTARTDETTPAVRRDEPSSQKSWGYVSVGAGAAGLVVGTIAGILVLDRKSTVTAECPTRTSCTKAGVEAAESGKSLATLSTIAFGVGLAGIGAGVTLIVTAPNEGQPSSAWAGVTTRF